MLLSCWKRALLPCPNACLGLRENSPVLVFALSNCLLLLYSTDVAHLVDEVGSRTWIAFVQFSFLTHFGHGLTLKNPACSSIPSSVPRLMPNACNSPFPVLSKRRQPHSFVGSIGNNGVCVQVWACTCVCGISVYIYMCASVCFTLYLNYFTSQLRRQRQATLIGSLKQYCSSSLVTNTGKRLLEFPKRIRPHCLVLKDLSVTGTSTLGSSVPIMSCWPNIQNSQ